MFATLPSIYKHRAIYIIKSNVHEEFFANSSLHKIASTKTSCYTVIHKYTYWQKSCEAPRSQYWNHVIGCDVVEAHATTSKTYFWCYKIQTIPCFWCSLSSSRSNDKRGLIVECLTMKFCSWWRPSWSKHSTIHCYENCSENIRNKGLFVFCRQFRIERRALNWLSNWYMQQLISMYQ